VVVVREWERVDVAINSIVDATITNARKVRSGIDYSRGVRTDWMRALFRAMENIVASSSDGYNHCRLKYINKEKAY
jgi:hypothetical protein